MADYSGNSGKKNDTVYWLIALGLIFTGVAAPVGVLMIVMSLLSGGKKRGRHPYYERRGAQEPLGARTSSREAAAAPHRREPASRNARSVPRDPVSALDRKGKRWAIAGGAVAALCSIAFLSSLGEPLHWLFQENLPLFIEDLMSLMALPCLAACGLGFLWAGLRRRKQASRYRSYLAMIGQQNVVSISALASAIGLPPAKVREDLTDMLDDGLFPKGFLDYGGDRLVLSGEGIAQTETPKQAPRPQPSKEDENALLAEIKEVNDAIKNERMSAQIDRIGVITAKILDYQKSHPERAAQLHSFLSYYLPTTLKILRAYGQLEAQEVAGENITAAMQRIEGMMDKVVEGFEKQLDLLFQGDAMDITTDVEVLERMLAKDGLSDREGLTLEL